MVCSLVTYYRVNYHSNITKINTIQKCVPEVLKSLISLLLPTYQPTLSYHTQFPLL